MKPRHSKKAGIFASRWIVILPAFGLVWSCLTGAASDAEDLPTAQSALAQTARTNPCLAFASR